MKRQFGYRGYDQEPQASNPWNVQGIAEIEEVHGWRLGGQYQPNVGITGLELRKTSAVTSDKHNDQAGVIPFIQNNEYVLHLLENTATNTGTTTRYWTIDSATYDDVFQDQTGSVAIDNATGRGTATFRTRFVHWFTSAPTFKLRIRDGSTSGPVIATFDLQPLLPTAIIQYFDVDGNIDTTAVGMVENQPSEDFGDFRMTIINIGENTSAGFDGKLKLQVASASFGTASAADISLPTLPFDQANAVVNSNTQQTGSGITSSTVFDFTDVNMNTDAITEGSETFTLFINAYKDPVVGGVVAIPQVDLTILDTSLSGVSFTVTRKTGGYPGYRMGTPGGPQQTLSFFYPQIQTAFNPSQGGNLNSLYPLGYCQEGDTVGFLPQGSSNAAGRYYYEVQPITTASSGPNTTFYNISYPAGNPPPQNIGNATPHLTPGQDTDISHGHFTIDNSGNYLGITDHDNENAFYPPTPYKSKEALDIKVLEDTFHRSLDGELHEGFKIVIYPENKTPATPLGSSQAIMVSEANTNGNLLDTEHRAAVTYNSKAFVNTTGVIAGSTEGFDVIDLYVGSSLNGQSKRIYVGIKIPNSGHPDFAAGVYDYAIAGLQILDLTQANPVKKAMPITTDNYRRWQIAGTNPLTESSNSDGYFETRNSVDTGDAGNGNLSYDYATGVAGNYTRVMGSMVGSTNNVTAGQWNVSMNGGGTPTAGTGMLTGIDPDTHSAAPNIKPINPARTQIQPPLCEPSVAAAANVGHYFFESTLSNSTNTGLSRSSFRSPKHTFSTGEVVRLCFAICTNELDFDFNAQDTGLYITVD